MPTIETYKARLEKYVEKYADKTMTRWRKKCVEKAKRIVKARDKFTCQKCLKRVKGVNCQASHVISEWRNKKLSCDPLNMKVLCYRCHKWRRHLEPTESGEWYKKKFPQRRKYLEKEHKEIDWSIWKQYFKEKYIELSLKLFEMWIQ